MQINLRYLLLCLLLAVTAAGGNWALMAYTARHAALEQSVIVGSHALVGMVEAQQSARRVSLEDAARKALESLNRKQPGLSGIVVNDRGQVVVASPADVLGSPMPTSVLSLTLSEHLAVSPQGWFHVEDTQGQQRKAYFLQSPNHWVWVGLLPACQAFDMLCASTRPTTAAALFSLLVLVAFGAFFAWRRVTEAKAGGTSMLMSSETSSASSEPVNVSSQDPQIRATAFREIVDRFSHELNNQLGIMSNSAYLIERRSQDSRLEVPVQAMLRAAESAGRLGFHLQKLGGGGQGPQVQMVDISHWLSNVKDVLVLALGKRATLEIQPSPVPLMVSIDPEALELAMACSLAHVGAKLEQGSRAVLTERSFEAMDGWPVPSGPYVELHFQALYLSGGESRTSSEHNLPDWTPAERADCAGLKFLGQVASHARGHAWVRDEPGKRVSVCVLLPLSQGSARSGC